MNKLCMKLTNVFYSLFTQSFLKCMFKYFLHDLIRKYINKSYSSIALKMNPFHKILDLPLMTIIDIVAYLECCLLDPVKLVVVKYSHVLLS